MAEVGGVDGSFAYSTTGNDPVAAEVETWTAQFRRIRRNTTPAGWTMERHYVGRLTGRVRFTLSANGTEIAPLPAGLVGTLTLTSSAGKTYSGNFTIPDMTHQFSSPQDFQGHTYEGMFSASSSSDAITDTHA